MCIVYRSSFLNALSTTISLPKTLTGFLKACLWPVERVTPQNPAAKKTSGLIASVRFQIDFMLSCVCLV